MSKFSIFLEPRSHPPVSGEGGGPRNAKADGSGDRVRMNFFQ